MTTFVVKAFCFKAFCFIFEISYGIFIVSCFVLIGFITSDNFVSSSYFDSISSFDFAIDVANLGDSGSATGVT